MRINEALGINRDLAFENHDAYYEKIVDGLGYESVRECVPYDKATISDALKKDKNLNNLPIKTWDRAAGFFTKNNGDVRLEGSRLTELYRLFGINIFSCSEGVCILKACARRMAAEI